MDLRLQPVRWLAPGAVRRGPGPTHRWLAWGRRLAGLCGLALVACAPPAADGPLRGFIADGAQRRAALLDSLWFRDNDYARLRLGRYASQDADSWDLLPVWLPPSAPVRSGAAVSPPPLALPVDASEAELTAALRRLGEAAFFNYPTQLVDDFELALRSPALRAAYGLWEGRAPADPADAAPRLGGLLRVELPGGSGTTLALSCASCHARASGAQVEPGRPADQLDIGALAQDQAPPGVTLAQAYWGRGRVDVSPDGADDPVVIPDLRVVAAQRYLHHEATVRSETSGAGFPLALAVRIETLLITTLHEQARPPPLLALALAVYLRSLAPPPPPPGVGRGQQLFAQNCQRCHAPPDYAGEPVAVGEIGTDPAAARSRERGTGTYRTPTLRQVAQRPALLHDGRLADLAALLDPARLAADYRGALHGDGPVPGHRYGLELASDDRKALLEFLQTL